MRRILALSLTAAALAVGALCVAEPASAAPTPGTLYFGGVSGSPTDCSTLANVGIYSDSAHTSAVTTITGTSGSLNIQNDCSTYAVAYTHTNGSGTLAGTAWGVGYSTFTSLSGSGTFTLYRCPSGTGTGSAGNCASPIPNNSLAATASFSVSGGGGGGGGGGPAPSTSVNPTPVIQQFGKPNSGTCDEKAPTELNWAGVASGGWSESWAQWMNAGNGGHVCTRTLTYSSSQAKWTVG